MADSKKAARASAALVDFAFIGYVSYFLVKALYEMNGDYIIGAGAAIVIIIYSRHRRLIR